jgi:nitroimidazol reductase NimA-like FMN-containing flavoprotein (pyridoxamine 5'-phosphate oxidase superfamily)
MPQKRNSPQKRSIPAKTKRGSVSVPERLDALNRRERHAVLSTDSKGQPYSSLVAFALLPDLKGAVFATPKATLKYENILENPQVALLIDTRSNREEDLMGAEAVTIIGRAKPVRRGKTWNDLSRILLQKHPGLTRFVRSATTALVLVEASHCIHVGQFQTVSRWDIA